MPLRTRALAYRLIAAIAVLVAACAELSGSGLPAARSSASGSPNPAKSGLGGGVSNSEGTGSTSPAPGRSGSPGASATPTSGAPNPTPVPTPTAGPTAEPKVSSLKLEPAETSAVVIRTPCEATISVPVREVGATPLFASEIQLKAVGLLLNGDPLTNLTWSSSDEEVATVEGGLVKAGTSGGTATITVTTREKHFATDQPATASCKINVTAVGGAEFTVN